MSARCVVGQELSGSYRLERLIGRGGMGEVWKASHLRLSTKSVAVKVIYHQGRELLERLEREALVMSGLQHPHVVHIEDLLKLPTGEPYIVMELLSGAPLSEVIARGPLDTEMAEQWLFEASDAIDTAHRHGVIHRDLKPDNLYLCDEEHLKVLDFGISSFNGGATLSSEGALIGTPYYMSPEQARGERVDPRSDLFSLGLIAIELITGQRAILGDSLHEILNNVVSFTPPSPPSGYPPERWAQLMSAVQLDRDARPSSVREWISVGLNRALPHRSINSKLKEQVTGAPSLTSSLSQTGSASLDETLASGVDGAHVDELMVDRSEVTTVATSKLEARQAAETLERHEASEISEAETIARAEPVERSVERAAEERARLEPCVAVSDHVNQGSDDTPAERSGLRWLIPFGLVGLVGLYLLSAEGPSTQGSDDPSARVQTSDVGSAESGLPAWYRQARARLPADEGERWVARVALQESLHSNNTLDQNTRALIQRLLLLTESEGADKRSTNGAIGLVKQLTSRLHAEPWPELLSQLSLLLHCAQGDPFREKLTFQALSPSMRQALKPQLSLCWDRLIMIAP